MKIRQRESFLVSRNCFGILLQSVIFFSLYQCSLAFSDRFQFEISENSPENSLVGQIVTRSSFTYRFKDDIAQFQLEEATGVIRTTTIATDRESRSEYNLIILSSSPTYPVEVRIKVLDQNDNAPFWPAHINTNLSFSESAPVGTKVMLDSAVDYDKGPLNYSLDSIPVDAHSLAELPFKLIYNVSTSFLHLEVTRKLDRELQPSYLLNITASDEAYQSASTLFSIKIIDSNDNPPIFDQSDYSISLNESMPMGVSILQVRASDADEEGHNNSRIAYYLSSSSSSPLSSASSASQNDFVIDPETGVISTTHSGAIRCGRASLGEFWRVCVFTVYARDFGSPRQDGRTYVTVKIYDSNNHAPAIKFRYFSKSSSASIDESATNGSLVAAVSVVDYDQGPNGKTSVELLPLGNELKHFRLDSGSGSHIIRVNGQLDREKIQLYNLTVVARDNGTPRRSSSAMLSIVVQDHNDHAPKFEQEVYEISLSETEQIGHFVAALRATDADEGINAQIYYSLSGPNSHFFKIDHQNGMIVTDKALDRESQAAFELKITARDSGSQPKWAHAVLKITVLDVNDNVPRLEIQDNKGKDVICSEGGCNVFHIDNNNFVELTIILHDPDLSENGTVSVALVYDYGGLFQIQQDSSHSERAKLISTRSLPLSKGQEHQQQQQQQQQHQQYKLVLEAKDHGLAGCRLHSLTTVELWIGQKSTLIEWALAPTKHLAFTPLDIDDVSGQQLTILPSIAFQNKPAPSSNDTFPPRLILRGGDSRLSLSEQGQLTINDRTNLVAGQALELEIVCEACKSGANLTRLTVLCLDRASYDTPMRHFQFNISEDASIGTFVGAVDIGKQQTLVGPVKHYFAFTLNAEKHFRLLEPDFREVKTAALLDRESIGAYDLDVVTLSVNSGKVVRKYRIQITLNDVPDTPTRFDTLYDVVGLDEGMAPGTALYRLHAQDGDSGEIKFTLQDNPYRLLEIVGSELQLSRSLSSVRRQLSHSSRTAGALMDMEGDKLLKVIVTADQVAGNRIPTIAIVGAESINASSSATPSRSVQQSRKRQTTTISTGSEPYSAKFTLYLSLRFSQSFSKPVFTKQFAEFHISEATAITERFAKIEARNLRPDSMYAILSGNRNDSFGILPSGQFYVNRRLDRESVEVFQLTVAIVEKRNTTLDKCKVLIRLTDANDNAPVFEHSLYQFSVPENEDKNFFVGRVLASDSDSGLNSRIIYSVIKSYYSSYVQIEPETGYLWTTQSFDRESLEAFEITIQAIDQPVDEAPRKGLTIVKITILDVNDNPPVFEIPQNITFVSKSRDKIIGSLSVSESVPEYSILANFNALDADLNASLHYELQAGDAYDGYFELNSNGSLVLLRKLDREARQEYCLQVDVSDGDYRAAFELRVTVEDVDDCEPMWANFTTAELNIYENATIGSEILTLQAIDADIGNNALFHFEIDHSSSVGSLTKSGSLPAFRREGKVLTTTQSSKKNVATSKVFDILTNKLVLVNHLDYEQTRFHRLNISLVESISRRVVSTRTVTINVLDINDCRPAFTQRTEAEVIRVPENVDIGTKLLTLQAIDCDADDQLTFEILACSTHYHTHKNIYQKEHELQHKHDSNNCPLKLNTKSGEVININALDREVIESINLHLTVRDSVGHTDRMKVIVIIEDINDESPMFVSPKNLLVDRDDARKAGAFLGSVKAMDLDMGINSAIHYRLRSEDLQALIEIDKQSGAIRLKQPIEYLLEDGPLTLNVSATDGGGLSTFDSIELILKPSLPFLEPDRLTLDIYENKPVGSQVTQLKCHDSNSLCQFYLINATDRNFIIDPLNGTISIVDLVDREMLAVRFLDILRIGPNNLQRILVQINVLDENDNPPYLTNTTITVHLSESLSTGTEFFSISSLVADEDISNKFDYQIINCSACDSTFGLARKTGALTLLRPLDSESVARYRILFGVSDGIYLLTSLVEIVVDDENDNKPYFNRSTYIFEIQENTDRGTLVGTIAAFDEDVSSKPLVYTYADGQELSSSFSLDSRTGEFTLSKKLDYEVDPSHYVFWVEASDGKFKSQPVKVIFSLINLPDNEPRFEQVSYRLEVAENRVQENILCVKAFDADLIEKPEDNDIDVQLNTSRAKIQLKYSIEQVNSAEECFEINPSSGCISVVKSLDREFISQLDLIVQVYDGFSNASTVVSVTVLDENDNFPEFEPNTVKVLRIDENLKIDSVVYTFKATDIDEAPNNYVKYELLNNSAIVAPVPFILGPIDGQLKVTGQIDAEEVDFYDLIIRATDFGFKTTDWPLKVIVEDLIDNVPKFPRDQITVNVFENASLGDAIFKLNAVDMDRTDEINYRIISESREGFFAIDNDYVVVSSQLNYEEITSFLLKIHAIDRAGNLDTLNLKIKLLNVFDERPIFLDSPYRMDWYENRLGVLDRFEAYSEDYPHKTLSSVSYLLLNNFENAFRINSTSGTVNVVKEIDRERLSESHPNGIIELRLFAIDTRSRLSSDGIVSIRILDQNDNAPVFDLPTYRFELLSNELLEANYTIGRVRAWDPDSGDMIQYRLNDTISGLFLVDSRGRIRIARPTLRRETQELTFDLTVIATDGIHSTSVSVRIFSASSKECLPKILKLNNILVQQEDSLKVSFSYQELQSLVEKRFPIIGFQLQKCVHQDEEVQFRISSKSFFELDSQSGLIRLDSKALNLVQSEPVHSFELTVSQRLSRTYTITIQTSQSKTLREESLIPQPKVRLRISENTSVGTKLFDFEGLKNSDIYIFAGDSYSQFEVKQNNLILVKPLDYEIIQNYHLFIRVKSGQAFEFAEIAVEILNENDNAPKFEKILYDVSLPEEEESGLEVIQLQASDADNAQTIIEYHLTTKDVPFRVDPRTGLLTTTEKIDRETNSSFRLTIEARDEQNLTSSSQVFITVQDKNDNPPRFTRLFRANITENIAMGSFVLQVKSHDRDSLNFSNVTYSMASKTDVFRLDSQTGNLYVSAKLDREKCSEYFLPVVANDGSWKSQTTVTIHILDENDNSPVFEMNDYQFDVILPEDAYYETIGKVNATDADEGLNGSVHFRLKQKSQYFGVEPHTGVISIKKMPKVFEDHKLAFLNQHFLTVIASDKSLVPRSAEVNVKIVLKPRLEDELLMIVIPEDLKNNSIVYTSNSMLSLAKHHETIVRTHFNHLKFSAEGNLSRCSNYLIEVDLQFGRQMINLTVVESNQFPPKFNVESNSSTVEENILPLDRVVGRFLAFDSDESSFNNQVRYSLNLSSIQWNPNVESYLILTFQDRYPALFKKNLSILELVNNIDELSNLLHPFRMDSGTGQLTLLTSLDFEVITKYSLLISAVDNAWYQKGSTISYDIVVGDLDDYIDYNLVDSSSLYNATSRPDPMSIGVFVVVFFFVILILVISTSFVFYHNQRKATTRRGGESTRKIFHSLNPYLNTNSSISTLATSGPQMSNPRPPVHRFHGRQLPHSAMNIQSSSHASQVQLLLPTNMPIRHNPPTQPAPQPPSVSAQLPHTYVHQLQKPSPSSSLPVAIIPSIRPHPTQHHVAQQAQQHISQHSPTGSEATFRHMNRSNIVSGSGSVLNGSESASVVASRIQMTKGGPSSIYTQNSNENFADNYSNIMAGGEHYDLENASNIAPSDIDIVFHCKGYRQRDPCEKERAGSHHAPLARLSPSVSELSAAPRILTLQDLSPNVPPPPPIRPHHRKTHSQLESVSQENLDQVTVTENSYSVSEYADNYEICGEPMKDNFQRVW